jgi:nicotinamidase-related amidase
MVTPDNSFLVLIDVQGKLAESMHEKELLFDNLVRLVRGMKALRVPIVWTEQIPAKMGPTIPPLSALLADETCIAKSSFSCCGEPAFAERLRSNGRRQAVIAGIEAHVCVWQTTADLEAQGYEVEVVADAISSRALSNKLMAIERIKACGARLTSVETVLFELMRTADHPQFRELLRIVK